MDMMMRHRAMSGEKIITPKLIFELDSPTNTVLYDVGINPFYYNMSFTILCEATFKNYSWSNNNHSLFGVTNTTSMWNDFRIGYIGSGQEYSKGIVSNSSVNRYTALCFNAASAGTKKMTSFYARKNSNQTSRLVVRYDASIFKIDGCSDEKKASFGNFWWALSSSPTQNITATIKLNGNGAGSTIQIFKLYDGLLTDQELLDFLNKITS